MKTAKTAPTRATNPRTASALFCAPAPADSPTASERLGMLSPTASARSHTFAARVRTLETTMFMA
ncbi:hypothetical protein [Actinomyces graevenitzii]|uniref:hypothetical protein n=1 Tax=Actinomyces graevenitzii TaxID=55565 RepID=UPI0011AEC459|nr:hypothetical protein [Actinomyces graevenitzii]